MDFNNGNLSQQQIQDLYKALSTNNFAQVQGPNAQTGGAAFIPESLESTLKTLTFTEEHIRLWKNIHKSKAFSTVEEYNVQNSYGEDVSGFQREGLAGVDTTGSYARELEKVKCLNTTRQVTHLLADLVKTTESTEAREIQSGMQWILGKTEEALFYGDSKLAPNGEEGIEWDGIITKADKANDIDLRGGDLTDTHINKAVRTIVNNYGKATAMYAPFEVSMRFSENFYPDQRAIMQATPGTITAGTVISKFNTVGGSIDIESDVFMRRRLIPLNPNKTAAGNEAATPPTVALTMDTTVLDAKFEEGVYKYAVVAVATGGNSVPVEASAAATITGSNKTAGVKLTITNSSVQMFAPEFFIIYRTEKDGTELYEIGRIGATSRDKSAVTEFVDKNEVLPNTGDVVTGDFTQNSLTFRQLAPMFKMDYAITQPIKRFGIFLYGTPIIYAPKRFVVIKNVKGTA